MIEEGLLLPLSVHRKGKCFAHNEPSVWYVKVSQNRNVMVTYKTRKADVSRKISSDGLLIFDRGHICVTGADLVYRRVNTDTLAKLLAFVDTAINPNATALSSVITMSYIPFRSLQLLRDKNLFEKWFLRSILNQDKPAEDLCDILRKTECYNLVRFLIESSNSTLSLHQLGKIYGLSYSHFRRLCRNALGGKVKSELCSWRMARCVLEMLEGENDMTTIAYKYGYSSSSHFSAEVKSKMGRSPREICRRLEK